MKNTCSNSTLCYPVQACVQIAVANFAAWTGYWAQFNVVAFRLQNTMLLALPTHICLPTQSQHLSIPVWCIPAQGSSTCKSLKCTIVMVATSVSTLWFPHLWYSCLVQCMDIGQHVKVSEYQILLVSNASWIGTIGQGPHQARACLHHRDLIHPCG